MCATDSMAVNQDQDNRIQQWLEESDEEEDDRAAEEDDMDSNQGEDNQEYSEHDTASENEAEEPGEAIIYTENRIPFVLGKDDLTRWQLHCPNVNPRVRRGRQNVVTEAAGVKGAARNAVTVTDAWKIFFPDVVIDQIVVQTNRFLQRIRQSYARERDCLDTNSEEILALFGLLYLAGANKSSKLDICDMWDKSMLAPQIFRIVMSINRFKLLLRALRFDNVNDREERRQQDKLAPIRELFEGFVERCMSSYSPGVNCTVDEMLFRFYGRCPFKQYIPSKPDKYGIKVFALVDSENFFTVKMEVYCGTQPDGPYVVDNSPSAVVKRIIGPIENTGRNITCDNWFSSVTLCRDLQQNHKTTLVGTVRKNRRELPKMIAETKKMPEKSSMFLFADRCTLVSYVPKKNRNVILISTMHETDTIDPDTGDNNKPEIITYYNKTKSGVDVVDQKRKQYTVKRVCNRWPLAIFFPLMDIAAINSQIVYQKNNGVVIPRKVYLKQLGRSLVRNYLTTRLANPNLKPDLKTLIRLELGIREEGNRDARNANNDREKCHFCPRQKNRKTKSRCARCGVPICGEHVVTTCRNCLGDQQADDEYDD